MQEKIPVVGDVIKSDKISFEGPDEWVVIESQREEATFGITPNDYIPGGIRLTVQQLNPDGTYNEKGFIYKFHITGRYKDLINIEELVITRKMKRIFI